MNKRHVNLGKVFSAPFESPYSMWRRFLSANRTLKRPQLNEILDQLPVEGIVTHTYFDNLYKVVHLNCRPQMVPSYLKYFAERLEWHEYEKIERHCPECARSGYHTDIFRLPWVKNCPLHGCDLTEQCALCHKNWPKWNQLFDNNCAVCGKISVKNSLDGKIESDSYQEIEKLYEFITYGQEEHIYIQSQGDADIKIRHPINLMDKNFPSYQINIYPKPISKLLKILGVEIYDIGLTNAHSVFSEPDKFGLLNNNFFETHENTIADTRMRALSEIHAAIKERTQADHHFCVYDALRLTRADLSNSKMPCLYCLALTCWYHLVCNVPYSPIHSNVGSIDFWFMNHISEKGAPIPVRNIVVGKTQYSLSMDTIMVLYGRDLLITYKSILNVIQREVLALRGDPRNKYSQGISSSGESNDSHQDESLFVSHTGRGIIICFLEKKVFTAEHLPLIEDADEVCHKFSEYLTNKYLFE